MQPKELFVILSAMIMTSTAAIGLCLFAARQAPPEPHHCVQTQHEGPAKSPACPTAPNNEATKNT